MNKLSKIIFAFLISPLFPYIPGFSKLAIAEILTGKYMYGVCEFYDLKKKDEINRTKSGVLYKVFAKFGDTEKCDHKPKIHWYRGVGESYVFCSKKTPFVIDLTIKDENIQNYTFFDLGDKNWVVSEDLRGEFNIYMNVCHSSKDGDGEEIYKNLGYETDIKLFESKIKKVKTVDDILREFE